MDTVVIKTRKKSDVGLLLDFSKKIGARVMDGEELEDMILGRLIEEGLKDPEYVRYEEVMKFLKE